MERFRRRDSRIEEWGWVRRNAGLIAETAHHLEKSAPNFGDSESSDAPLEWFRCLCLLFLSRLGVLFGVTQRRIRLIATMMTGERMSAAVRAESCLQAGTQGSWLPLR
jgi:hypothetical protein